jgi:hypothetical protein
MEDATASKLFQDKCAESNFLIYESPNEEIRVDVFLHNETIWLTQKKIAELFGVQRPAITKHLKNIFNEKELDEQEVSSSLEHTTKHGAIKGKTQINLTKFYNLDAIIAVGYRVNSKRATQFRIWATKVLKEYIIKGFAMDDYRLKNPDNYFGKDYFDEQIARIRDIRSSERRFYQKITDIYSKCSVDYDYDSKITKRFFATVQNKLHWAITNQTAAELIFNRVDNKKNNLGLTSWKNSPKGIIRKSDVTVAKNYLNKKEIDDLNRIVTMYLDYAEVQAKNKQVMCMDDWVKKLDAFLKFNEKEILKDSGKISVKIAKLFAEKQFDEFKINRDKLIESDFDKLIKKNKRIDK